MRDYAALTAGCDEVFGIATSALRDAADRAAFEQRFKEASGTALAVLSGEEEAVASYEGAMAGLRASAWHVGAPHCVIDVGGGSTEVATALAAGAAPAIASLQVGAVRLTEKHLPGDPPSPADVDRCRLVVRAALAALPERVRPAGEIIAVGGTANTAARMLQAMDENAKGAVAAVDASDLRTLLDATLSMSVGQRRRLHGLPAQRADIFPAGLLILDEVLHEARTGRLIVSQSDLLLGYASRRTEGIR